MSLQKRVWQTQCSQNNLRQLASHLVRILGCVSVVGSRDILSKCFSCVKLINKLLHSKHGVSVGPPKCFEFVTTFSTKIEAKLRNLNASILLDSESVRSLTALIHIRSYTFY